MSRQFNCWRQFSWAVRCYFIKCLSMSLINCTNPHSSKDVQTQKTGSDFPRKQIMSFILISFFFFVLRLLEKPQLSSAISGKATIYGKYTLTIGTGVRAFLFLTGEHGSQSWPILYMNVHAFEGPFGLSPLSQKRS